MTWNAGTPSIRIHMDEFPSGAADMALHSRMKAMHHHIRRGNGDKAARVARELFHQVNAILRKREAGVFK